MIEKSPVDLSRVPDPFYILDLGDDPPHAKGMTLYDEGGVRVTLPESDFDPDFLGGYSVPLVFENNTDRYLRVMSLGFAVNGRLLTHGGIYGNADSNSTGEAEFVFTQSDMNRGAMGLSVPEHFQFRLVFFDIDAEEDNARYAISDVISFSAQSRYRSEDNFAHYPLVLHDSDLFRLCAGQLYQDDRGKIHLQITIENTSQLPLSISAKNITVNGVAMGEQLLSMTIPGCTCVKTIEFSADEMKDAGLTIEDISQLQLELVATHYYEPEALDTSGVLSIPVK